MAKIEIRISKWKPKKDSELTKEPVDMDDMADESSEYDDKKEIKCPHCQKMIDMTKLPK